MRVALPEVRRSSKAFVRRWRPRVLRTARRPGTAAGRSVATFRRHIERRAEGDQLTVSVIIPIYNAGDHLEPLLESLAAQDLDAGEFEVIAIDDGSTDGSGKLLDKWTRRVPNMTVVHQENSGWPGLPRNSGFDLSTGRYVFFADADDWLAPGALRGLTRFADRHQSDIVMPKMAGVDGRWVPSHVYRSTRVDAPLEHAFKTLSPQKLFRRSLLEEHDIRFPTGKVRLEDGMFLARAYLLAWRVSTLADDDLYFIRKRNDATSLSRQALDPADYTWSVGEVARLIRDHDDDPDRADRVVLDLYRRKCLKIYEPSRWLKYNESVKRSWLGAHGALISRHIPLLLESSLESPFLERSRAARTGDIAVVDCCCEDEARTSLLSS